MKSTIETCREELRIIDDILVEREQQHGDPQDNLERIATYWGTYLGKHISCVDVGLMMLLMKMARLNTGNVKTDSVRDLVGYAAIATGLQTLSDKAQKSAP